MLGVRADLRVLDRLLLEECPQLAQHLELQGVIDLVDTGSWLMCRKSTTPMARREPKHPDLAIPRVLLVLNPGIDLSPITVNWLLCHLASRVEAL